MSSLNAWRNSLFGFPFVLRVTFFDRDEFSGKPEYLARPSTQVLDDQLPQTIANNGFLQVRKPPTACQGDIDSLSSLKEPNVHYQYQNKGIASNLRQSIAKNNSIHGKDAQEKKIDATRLAERVKRVKKSNSSQASVFDERDDCFEVFQERKSHEEFRSCSQELSREISFNNKFESAKKEQKKEEDCKLNGNIVRKQSTLILKKSLDFSPRGDGEVKKGNFFVRNGYQGLEMKEKGKDSSLKDSRPKIPSEFARRDIKGVVNKEISLTVNNLNGLKSQLNKVEDKDLASRNEKSRLGRPQPFKVFAEKGHQGASNKEASGQSSMGGFKFLRSGTKKQESKV